MKENNNLKYTVLGAVMAVVIGVAIWGAYNAGVTRGEGQVINQRPTVITTETDSATAEVSPNPIATETPNTQETMNTTATTAQLRAASDVIMFAPGKFQRDASRDISDGASNLTEVEFRADGTMEVISGWGYSYLGTYEVRDGQIWCRLNMIISANDPTDIQDISGNIVWQIEEDNKLTMLAGSEQIVYHYQSEDINGIWHDYEKSLPLGYVPGDVALRIN